MDLELTPDQSELSSVAEQVLDRRSPFSLAREYVDGGGSAGGIFRELGDLGWYGVGLDEDDPFGLTGLTLLAQQCGQHATPNVLVDTALGARLAGALPDPQDTVARLARGEATAALCVLEAGADWTLKCVTTTASAASDAGGRRLSGTKLGVEHASDVEVLVVLADVEGAVGVVFVDAIADDRISIELEPGIDPSAAPCRVVFADVDVPAEHVLADADVGERLNAAFAIGAVATAAEAIGAASRALSMAIEYSKERHQFGRPIGSFQAIQHLLADLHVQRETAWAAVLYAAAALDEQLPERFQAAAVAKAHGSQASRSVIEGALQVFGGVAFTWEHDAHLLQRRVLRCEHRFGDAGHHEHELGRQLVTHSR